MKAVVKCAFLEHVVAHKHAEEGQGCLGALDPDLVKRFFHVCYSLFPVMAGYNQLGDHRIITGHD